MSYDQRFSALKDLPPPPQVPSGAHFVLYRRNGKTLITSGYGPLRGDAVPDECKGKVGKDITVQQGYDAARLTAINLLLIARQALGSLDRVSHIESVTGVVNCDPDFTDHPTVINGCSDLLVEIFDTHGQHTRSAIGSNALAFGIAVEISLTLVEK